MTVTTVLEERESLVLCSRLEGCLLDTPWSPWCRKAEREVVLVMPEGRMREGREERG